MMRYKAALTMTCLLAFASAARAEEGLVYKNKPVDPFCVETLLGMSDQQVKAVDLAKCGPDGRVIEKGDRFKPDKDGWIGFEEQEEDGMGKPYFQYRVAGTLADGSALVETQSSGGGSGQFSNVASLAIDKATLKRVKDFIGGDRCNNGITAASVLDGKPVVRYSVTPADMANIFVGDGKYEPYKDLESSAASCAGEVEETDGAITALFIDKAQWAEEQAGEDQEWLRQYKFQGCFNAYMTSYASVAEHADRLSPDEARALMKGFDETCGNNKPERKRGIVNE